jgi:nicotinate-nucleotide adenylyltransferase
MRIGLLGGSFNPAHRAHRDLSLLAWKRLGLDRVWWLVSPGNPLKENSKLPRLERRLAQARNVAASPVIDVTGTEVIYRTRYTYDLVVKLRQNFPRVRFVWLMGADNLAQFHRWHRWREIAQTLPFAVIERPGFETSPLSALAAQALSRHRIDESDAPLLPSLSPPAWVYLHGLKSELSSTSLRAGTASHRNG